MKKSTFFTSLCLIIFLLATTTVSNPGIVFAQPFEPFSQSEQPPDIGTTEEPTTEEPTTEEPTTEEPTTEEPTTEEPISDLNATGVNASGVTVGPNATTNTQQIISNILTDIREPETNQTEIAELEEELPLLLSAISQVGQDGETPSNQITITRTCEYEYDANGNRTKKTCKTTISL